jgi:hypothetical protein
MSTVKISQLPIFSTINANTANTLFVGVDVPTDTTFQMTATTLAQGLYSNNPLKVGVNPIQLANTVAQFSNSDPAYVQVNMQNFNANGSADYVTTADIGTNSNNYVDLGINNSQFNGDGQYSSMKPLDGYLYVHGSTDTSSDGNLIIGTSSTGANVYFVAGNTTAQNIIMTLTKSGLVLNTQSSLTFSDGTVQSSAVSNVYVQSAFNQANTANTLGQNVLVYASAAYNQANLTAGGLIASNANVGLLQSYSNQANANIALLQSYSNQANANIVLLFAISSFQNTVDSIQTSNIAAAFNQANVANSIANTAVQNTATIGVNNLNVNGLFVNRGVGSQSPTGGGLLQIQNEPGSSELSGSRLGGVFFGGNTSIAVQNRASVEAFAAQNWNLSSQGTKLAFYTTANGDTNRSLALTIDQDRSVSLTGNLIANSVGQGIFVDKFTSNSATFTQNLVVLGNLNANTLLGNIFFSNVTTTTTQSNSILWTTQSGFVTQQTAQLWYYGNTQSLILDTDIAGDRLSISKVLFFRGFNSTGATIPANSFVRLVSGVTSNQIPYLALADATSSANATVAGFVKNAIANGAFGFAYSQGIVEDLNSTGLGQNGDILFLSTTPGLASNVAPLSGNSNTVVQLGRVILSDATQGKLFIQNQLRQAYGRTNGSVLYAYANNIVSSNSLSINDSTGIVTANTIVANTVIQYNAAVNNNTATQLSSKSTTVTSNGRTGQITTSGAALNKGVAVQFTVNNSYIVSNKDVVILNIASGASVGYGISVNNITPGSFQVNLHNSDSTPSGSNASDTLVINYAIIRVN